MEKKKCPVANCHDDTVYTRAKLSEHLQNIELHQTEDLLNIAYEPWYIFDLKTQGSFAIIKWLLNKGFVKQIPGFKHKNKFLA